MICKHSCILTEERKIFKKYKPIKARVRFKLDSINSSSKSDHKALRLAKIKMHQKAKCQKKPLQSLSSMDLSEENSSSEVSLKLSPSKETSFLKKFNSERSIRSSLSSIDNENDVFKVYLENGTIKCFKYDGATKISDVLLSLKEKLNLENIDYYGICAKINALATHNTSRCNIKFFNEACLLQEIIKEYKLISNESQFAFRFIFLPSNLDLFYQDDLNSFNYLYNQVILIINFFNFICNKFYIIFCCL